MNEAPVNSKKIPMATDETDARERMAELNEVLTRAAEAYYNEDTEIMSNYEYDALYDELLVLESKWGASPDSITQRVGAELEGTDDKENESSESLPKVEHETPMLSLDKTKSLEFLSEWLGEHIGCLSWKLDGSTVVLTYDQGSLSRAVTRGNGRIGEDITRQAKKFTGVPMEIPYRGRIVIRGEAVMTYSEFERINKSLDAEAKYKNPRNLASGTMRALDDTLLDEREIRFVPFELVDADESLTTEMSLLGHDSNSFANRLDWLESLGFSPVDHRLAAPADLTILVEEFEQSVPRQDIPSDGLVLVFDDVAYGESLGTTSHAPKNGMAFKWSDETADTKLRDIVWQPSRTGRINPVAVFDPVELEGTTVERATLNNLSFIADMLGVPKEGQALTVYKANKIIPTIVSAEKGSKNASVLEIPDRCPACGHKTERVDEHGSEFLMCLNSECPAKRRGALVHFASRDALDIRGISKETIERLEENGIIESYRDLLEIADKRTQIVGIIEKMGEKSFDNLVVAVEKARHTTAARFLYSLGIREIGRKASSDIVGVFDNDIEKIIETGENGDKETFLAIDGVGAVMAEEICRYMASNGDMVRDILQIIDITDKGEKKETAMDLETSNIAGKTFVVTGKVYSFANRKELENWIVERGGKLAGSVSGKTDYLVTNTPDSGTAKNQKAQVLGVPIITEDELIALDGE